MSISLMEVMEFFSVSVEIQYHLVLVLVGFGCGKDRALQ